MHKLQIGECRTGAKNVRNQKCFGLYLLKRGRTHRLIHERVFLNSFKCIRERKERCQGFVLTSLLPLSHLLNFCKSLYQLQPYSIMFKVVVFFYFSKGQSWSEWRHWGECRTPCGYGYRHRYRDCINPGDGKSCEGRSLEYGRCPCPRGIFVLLYPVLDNFNMMTMYNLDIVN